MHIFFPAKGLRLIALEQHVFVAVKISYINPRLYMLQSRMSGTRRSRMTNEQLRKSSRQQQPTGRPRPSGRRRHAPDELKQNRNIRGLSTLPISRRRYRLEPSPIAIGVTRNRPLKRRLCAPRPRMLQASRRLERDLRVDASWRPSPAIASLPRLHGFAEYQDRHAPRRLRHVYPTIPTGVPVVRDARLIRLSWPA